LAKGSVGRPQGSPSQILAKKDGGAESAPTNSGYCLTRTMAPTKVLP
jgi:hypothetical protein